ncbi:uncharacterized protein LOC113847485 isoform X2 [Abrus precatorius]|uniref:Uncharacterized protein LOC113847485 isoform X2 n=1 Tax=Abrus precatorius TaxID=3816 RepID=A0A8B8JLT8_ABRPR|nr:uncharacterized protein LOC113847485 isoform X2 [Abrus precatorius]
MDTKTSQTRTRRSPCSSPEFEFWMVRNPSFPQPNILSADELFVDGVLLPLHLLNNPQPPPPQNRDPEPPPDPDPEPEPSPAITDSAAAATTFSSSKRWMDIFRKSDKKTAENNNAEESEKDKEKAKKKEKKSGSGGVSTSTELNINIWPFSRSRSAGNTGTRPKLFPGAPATRKVNSAPCSRSNSGGESKSRKWPSSPGRAGVHLGRSSPVWQVRRAKNPEAVAQRESSTSRRSKVASSGAKGKVLNLNVPTCISYKHHLSCRSDQNTAIPIRVSDSSDIRARANANANGSVGVYILISLFIYC